MSALVHCALEGRNYRNIKERRGKKNNRKDEGEQNKEAVGARAVEIKRKMEARKEDTVYGDALFVTAVCCIKTGPL